MCTFKIKLSALSLMHILHKMLHFSMFPPAIFEAKNAKMEVTTDRDLKNRDRELDVNY